MLIRAPLACCIARKPARHALRTAATIVAAKGAVRVVRTTLRTGAQLATLGLLLRLTRPWA